MKNNLFLICTAALSLASLADVTKVVFPSENQRNFEKHTKVAVGADAGEGNDFVVTCTLTSRCETAWQIVSGKMPIPTGTAGFAFDFEIQTDADWLTPGTSDSWGSAVTWYESARSMSRSARVDLSVSVSVGRCRITRHPPR